MIVSVRHPNPFLTFWCGTEGENAPDLDLVCLCSWLWTCRGPCKSWSCHCSVLIFNLPKPCRGSEALQFSTLEQMLIAKMKKEVSGVCFEDVVYCKVFSSWHFTVAQVENVNLKISIFSMDHQDYLKPKSINLPATERFLVTFPPLYSSGTTMKGRVCTQYYAHNQCNLRFPLVKNLSKCDFRL